MHLITIGDNVVDRYTSRGLMFPGGSTLNVAVFAARAGIKSSYIGIVGDDREGRLIRSAAEAEGVDISLVATLPGATASTNVSLVEGDRSFAGSSKGVSVFVPTASHLTAVEKAHVVHTGHSSVMEHHLSDLAKRTPLSFDFSDRHEDAYLERVMPYVQFAHFSASDLSPKETARLIERALAFAPRSLLVTQGANGADYFEDGEHWHQPAMPTQVTDTLGAGDTMIATLLARRGQGVPPAAALADAAAAAAKSCTYFGAFGYGTPLAEAVSAQDHAIEYSME
ncbi:PfkB family carbohydrate kinase [Arthrobacter sp. 2RAF6]|uniref:PfkB family carbohydrate kinase n=1 Tax=Arthrobacter sp. 2RAF6 TaxID=3233002 RepID=UPI003F8E0ED8